MRNFLVTAAVVGALSFAGLGAAGAAAAVAFGGATAADTVSIPRPEGLEHRPRRQGRQSAAAMRDRQHE